MWLLARIDCQDRTYNKDYHVTEQSPDDLICVRIVNPYHDHKGHKENSLEDVVSTSVQGGCGDGGHDFARSLPEPGGLGGLHLPHVWGATGGIVLRYLILISDKIRFQTFFLSESYYNIDTYAVIHFVLLDTALLMDENTLPPLWKNGLVVINPMSEAATEIIDHRQHHL